MKINTFYLYFLYRTIKLSSYLIIPYWTYNNTILDVLIMKHKRSQKIVLSVLNKLNNEREFVKHKLKAYLKYNYIFEITNYLFDITQSIFEGSKKKEEENHNHSRCDFCEKFVFNTNC